MTGNRASDAPTGRRDRQPALLVVALVTAAVLLVTGGVIWYVASANADSGVQASDQADQGAPVTAEATPSPAATTAAPAAAWVPAGIVLLTDPAWVLRVSEASGIPTRALSAYAGADLWVREHEGCAVGWNTLAGIGFVESEHGTLHGGAIDPDGVARPEIIGILLDGTSSAAIPDTDNGSLDGDAAWDRAVGPMQFIPGTWEIWGTDANDDGIADIHNIDDAALTAARYLCHAYGTLDGSASWIGAIRSYNDSADYQDRVADAAAHYASLN
ncbi:lytic murein transglycosylase [Microbacterium sp.]|uniref:lytic murein transglycosylase n=1 Tax=Microbacterium sp. TaxID=51671 RepID=UPI0039E5EDF1